MTDKTDPRHPEHKAAVRAADLFGSLPARRESILTWTEAMAIAKEMMDQYDEKTRDDSGFIARPGWITRRAAGTPLLNGMQVLIAEAIFRGYRHAGGKVRVFDDD